MVHLAQIQHFALRLSRPRTSPSIKDIGQVGPKWAGPTRALARRRRRNTRRQMGQGIGMFVQAILRAAQLRGDEAATICDGRTRSWSESADRTARPAAALARSEEPTSELQALMRISYAVFCLKKKRYETPK